MQLKTCLISLERKNIPKKGEVNHENLDYFSTEGTNFVRKRILKRVNNFMEKRESSMREKEIQSTSSDTLSVA